MRRAASLTCFALAAAACRDPSSQDGPDGPASAAPSASVFVIPADPVVRDCNGQPEDGDETRLGTDAHCGGCDQACKDGDHCVGEVCLGPADVAMSGTHTCALAAGGGVHCWGANEAGEVGDGTTLVRDRPVPVKGLDDAVQLTVRDRETCVRRRSGAVACWGEAFGTGRPGTNRLEPTEVPALRGATDLALGNGVLCGLVPERGIVCLPAFKSDKAIREVGPPPGPPVSDAVDLAATANGLCAARRAGDVVCWNLRPFDDLAPEEREWKVEGVQGALALVAGLETVCALRSGNRAACWGGGIVTARGGIRDDIVGGVHDFGAVGAVTDLAFLGWPSDDDCATRVDGATVCWDQPFIELSARTEPRRVATRPMPLPAAVHVEATVDRSHCALTEAGDVYCWGELALGRLGVGRAPEQLGPRPIEGVEDVKLVVASDHRACARTKSGALTCWGGGHTPGRVKLDGLDRLLSGRCASVRHELACFGDLFTSPLPSSGLRDVVQLVPAAQGSNVLSYWVQIQPGRQRIV